MKNKKLIIIVVIVLAVILVGVGTFFLLQSLNANTGDKEEIKETRNYQTVTEVADASITSKEPTTESFEQEVKEIGFDKVNCENDNCFATNQGYSNTEYEDIVSFAKDENNGKTISTMLYFLKEDFTIDNIYSNLNAITKNYFGTETTKSQIEEVKKGLENSSDDYYQQTYLVGNYTIEINMQNVVDTDFKLVKYLALDTSLYNQYHNQ